MKMEHTVVSPRDGRVAAVHFAAGALVTEGAQLVALEPVPDEG
jgi:3-methylcrotonyl-CoA carboxylase alpha subunit